MTRPAPTPPTPAEQPTIGVPGDIDFTAPAGGALDPELQLAVIRARFPEPTVAQLVAQLGEARREAAEGASGAMYHLRRAGRLERRLRARWRQLQDQAIALDAECEQIERAIPLVVGEALEQLARGPR